MPCGSGDGRAFAVELRRGCVGWRGVGGRLAREGLPHLTSGAGALPIMGRDPARPSN